MTVAHIVVEGGEDSDFKKRIEPGLVDEAGDEHHGGTGVVGQRIGHPHQGEALTAELFSQRSGDVGCIGIILPYLSKEPLELGRDFLLFAAPAQIEKVESVVPKMAVGPYGERSPLPFWHIVDETLLGGRAVQFAAFLAFQEEEVNLAVVVGQLALARMPIETGVGTE